MSYLLFTLFFCLIFGLLGVVSHPSPYFGAVSLVVSAAVGCGVLVGFGGTFVSLVLFLIYLGGMLVVFGYSVALASDPHPDTWGSWSVGLYLLGYVFLVVVLWGLFGDFCGLSIYGLVGGNIGELFVLRGDFDGVSLFYSVGGVGLLLCGWGLLLTLFVVLELSRGVSRGTLRAV
uniref:NADH-ubiquinone oxidoreductase chain 6 n=1 Tax=Basiliscus vittatus TaxID=211979 RepID=C4T873_BASVI|nr:NADH dehydrogenase subunit 6 [Basiliscus vittatus]BAH70393.1 NADH dehydrogenase subunit 6 [Basiliscus vittatus]